MISQEVHTSRVLIYLFYLTVIQRSIFTITGLISASTSDRDGVVPNVTTGNDVLLIVPCVFTRPFFGC